MIEFIDSLTIFARDVGLSLGYPGVALAAFLENFFPPIPSEVVFPFFGFVSAGGGLNLFLVVASGSLGALAGALFWYGLGSVLGRANLKIYIERFGKYLRLGYEDIERAERWFERYEAPAVFFGRLVPLVRTLISVPAGFVRMSVFKFVLYSLLGSLVWTGALSYGGFFLGERWESVAEFVKDYELAVGLGLLALLLFALVRIFILRRNR
ncbi:DedA family protein [Candidatus Saccharibacteria bacterium]|nr:DedA family protein [Candidatus Saccharibacteria bacterium]